MPVKPRGSNLFHFSKISYLLIIISTLLSCSATKKVNKSILNTLEKSPNFQSGFSGLAIYDPSSEKMLFEYNASKNFIPASNIKLFTFYTGIKILGDSIPGLKFITTKNSLIFTGTGDPSFLNPDLPDSKIFQFFNSSDKALFYLAPVYTESHYGPGWAWDDYNDYYSAERSAFPIYGNTLTFSQPTAGTSPTVYPAGFKPFLKNSKEISKDRIRRDQFKNEFYYRATQRDTSFKQHVPFIYSDSLFTKLLSDTLHREVKLIKKLPEINSSWKTVNSIPADSIYKKMLQESDNFIAEQILLMAAGKISDTLKTKIAIDYMKKEYLKDLPDVPKWVDGSGLSRYNLSTPRTMLKLLKKIISEVPQERLFQLLPSGGYSGTLKNSYKAEQAYIFAKTGSLSNNHSLSGYLITNSGRLLIFSFMNSNYTTPTSNIKSGMQQILELVRDHY